jgi:cytochrome c
MIFAGIPDDQARADLITFLKEATRPGAATTQMGGGQGGMGGMMGMGANAPNLKTLSPDLQVEEITYAATPIT